MTNFLKILRCIFLLTLAVGQGIADNAPIEGQWIINNNGETTEEAISGRDILITLPFSASNRTVGADVYTKDCVTRFNNSLMTLAAVTLDTTEPTSDADDGFIQFNTTLEVDINSFNGTKYYEPFTDGTRGGYIQLCVETFLSINDRADLGNDDYASQKVNFTNNILNISVSLTSDFQVGSVNVEREQVDTENVETDYSEFISAFICDAGLLEIAQEFIKFKQGERIRLCVYDIPNDAAIPIVQVEEFDSLVVSQDGNTPYNFVKNSLFNPEITTLTCDEDGSLFGRRVCYAEFVALPRFFAEAEPNELTISGTVFVVRDGARVRRSLRMAPPAPEDNNAENAAAVSGRRAQAEGEEGSGNFEVFASLESTADSAAPGLTAAVAGLVSVAVGAAGDTLMA